MRRVALASHGNLSIGMKHTVEMISGGAVTPDAIAAFVDGVTLEDKIESFFAGIGEGDEALVFTDLLGGSVNRAFLPYAERPGVFVVTGMSLGMVLEAALLPGVLTREAIDAAIERAKAGATGMWSVLAEASEDDE